MTGRFDPEKTRTAMAAAQEVVTGLASIEDAVRSSGLNRSSIRRAIYTLTQGVPELIEAVSKGEVSLFFGERISFRPPDEQRSAVRGRLGGKPLAPLIPRRRPRTRGSLDRLNYITLDVVERAINNLHVLGMRIEGLGLDPDIKPDEAKRLLTEMRRYSGANSKLRAHLKNRTQEKESS